MEPEKRKSPSCNIPSNRFSFLVFIEATALTHLLSLHYLFLSLSSNFSFLVISFFHRPKVTADWVCAVISYLFPLAILSPHPLCLCCFTSLLPTSRSYFSLLLSHFHPNVFSNSHLLPPLSFRSLIFNRSLTSPFSIPLLLPWVFGPCSPSILAQAGGR